jgi:hypothetical protein
VHRAETGIPDVFMFRDPHNSYERGEVYDDVTLEYGVDEPTREAKEMNLKSLNCAWLV